MADEVTSGEIRTRRFDVVRKGYDRNQVELFLAQLARQFDALESSIADAADSEMDLGIDDSEALARELASIGGEIGVILESARAAAEGIRTRATTDADSWTSEAKTYVEESTSQADIQAHAARGSAWDEGSTMLSVATDEATRMVAEAETDALRIRAEAEREAIRYTNDAKRASEEAIGAAENEAEGILSTSRAESERVVRSANQSAELAQERARALEDRRAELLTELESTRSSIGDLETEIESKRQALEEPEPVVAPEYEERPHHDTEGGTVKIISGSKVVPLTPVDADSFVAEVVEMRRSAVEDRSQPSAVSQEEIPDTRYQTPEEDGSQLTVDSARSGEESPQFTVDSSRSEEIPDTRYQIPEEEQLTADSAQSEEELAVDTAPLVEESAFAEPEPAEDSIGSLFAQLRKGSQKKEDSSQLTVDGSQSEEVSSAESASDAESGKRKAESASDAESTVEPDNASLIPVQNAALRTIKRQLVDLQNDALEHLRTDEAWVPDEEFTDQFSEPFNELAAAIADDGDDGGAASVFATDLYDAVSNAVVGARDAGSGDRAIAAATSKVFRTWRSDEAERRVVAVASDLSEYT